MAQLPQGRFDATQVDPSQNFEPIPPADYLVHVTASDLKPTKDGSGQFILLDLEVLDGQYKGRKLWERLNIRNKSQQAEEIAYRTLSAICHATGKMQVADTVELHNIPMIATVKIRSAQGQYSAQNEVAGYKPASTQGMKMPAQAAPAQPAPAAAPASSTPPWARKAS